MKILFANSPCTRPAIVAAISCVALLAGCKSSTPPQTNSAQLQLAAHSTPQAPPRPTVAPPAFKVFHHDASSITLVTDEHATDEQIEAILWQLHDAARAHSFDKLGIPQKLVDARDPMIWFHLYRGSKCASEKYTSAALPCGPSYHAAGDYTLGGFTDKDHDDALLLHDENHQVHLWNSDTHGNTTAR